MPDGKLRRYAAEDAAPEQFRVAAIHVRADGEVWVGAVEGLYRLPAGSSGDRLERVAIGREKPDNVRGFAEDPAGHALRGQQAGDPPPDRPLSAQVHVARRPEARISSPRSPSPPTAARS